MTTTPKPDAGGHTPEPWKVRIPRDDRMGAFIEAPAPGKPYGEEIGGDDYHYPERRTPDLYRIVACVNAMAGIADPATLRAQRDDLLAALKSLRDIIHDDLTHAQQQHHAEAINFADLVLRKAGGGE